MNFQSFPRRLRLPGRRCLRWLTALGWCLAAAAVWADIPTPKPPSTNPAAGDYLGLIKGYAKDGVAVASLVAGGLMLIGAAWATWAAFCKMQERQLTTGQFAMSCGIGIVVVLLAMYLLVAGAGVIV